MMKTIMLGAIILCLILVAGCTTGQSNSGVPAQSLKMNEPAVLQNGSYTVTTLIDHIDVDSSKPGKKIIDIYIKAINSGTQPIQLVWYSKITDQAGVSHGGIGVSHGGSGAETPRLIRDHRQLYGTTLSLNLTRTLLHWQEGEGLMYHSSDSRRKADQE
jgi:hypothetical protein